MVMAVGGVHVDIERGLAIDGLPSEESREQKESESPSSESAKHLVYTPLGWMQKWLTGANRSTFRKFPEASSKDIFRDVAAFPRTHPMSGSTSWIEPQPLSPPD
jgi:hypothetical protein